MGRHCQCDQDMPQVVKKAALSSHMAESNGPGLISNYGMSAEETAFFGVHDEIEEKVPPINALLLARYDRYKDCQRIIRAVRLSYPFEVLFDGTVMAATPPGK
jgi:hypothetical protein